jgi:hypothetical protein
MKCGALAPISEARYPDPGKDGTAIFPSVPAAIFTITDQTKERYKKLHAFQSPFGSSRREIGKHGVYL